MRNCLLRVEKISYGPWLNCIGGIEHRDAPGHDLNPLHQRDSENQLQSPRDGGADVVMLCLHDKMFGDTHTDLLAALHGAKFFERLCDEDSTQRFMMVRTGKGGDELNDLNFLKREDKKKKWSKDERDRTKGSHDYLRTILMETCTEEDDIQKLRLVENACNATPKHLSLRHFFANAVLSNPEEAEKKFTLSIDDQLRLCNVSDLYGSFDFLCGQKLRRKLDKLGAVLQPLKEILDDEEKLLKDFTDKDKSVVKRTVIKHLEKQRVLCSTGGKPKDEHDSLMIEINKEAEFASLEKEVELTVNVFFQHNTTTESLEVFDHPAYTAVDWFNAVEPILAHLTRSSESPVPIVNHLSVIQHVNTVRSMLRNNKQHISRVTAVQGKETSTVMCTLTDVLVRFDNVNRQHLGEMLANLRTLLQGAVSIVTKVMFENMVKTYRVWRGNQGDQDELDLELKVVKEIFDDYFKGDTEFTTMIDDVCSPNGTSATNVYHSVSFESYEKQLEKTCKIFFGKRQGGEPPASCSMIQLDSTLTGRPKCAAALTALVESDMRGLLLQAREDVCSQFVVSATAAAKIFKAGLVEKAKTMFQDGILWGYWNHVKCTIERKEHANDKLARALRDTRECCMVVQARVQQSCSALPALGNTFPVLDSVDRVADQLGRRQEDSTLTRLIQYGTPMVSTLKRLAVARARETKNPDKILQLPALREMPDTPDLSELVELIQLKKDTVIEIAKDLFPSIQRQTIDDGAAFWHEYNVKLESNLEGTNLIPWIPDESDATADPGTVRHSVESLVLATCERISVLNNNLPLKNDVTQVTRWLAREYRDGDPEQPNVFKDPDNLKKVSQPGELASLLAGIRDWCLEFRINVLLVTGCKVILILGEEIFDHVFGRAFPLALRYQEGGALSMEALKLAEPDLVPSQLSFPIEGGMTTRDKKRKADDVQATDAVSPSQAAADPEPMPGTNVLQAMSPPPSPSAFQEQAVNDPSSAPLVMGPMGSKMLQSLFSLFYNERGAPPIIPWTQPLENVEYRISGRTGRPVAVIKLIKHKHSRALESIPLYMNEYKELRGICGAFVETSEYNVPYQDSYTHIRPGDDAVFAQSTFGVVNDGVGGANGPKALALQGAHPSRDKALLLKRELTVEASRFADNPIEQKDLLERQDTRNVALTIMRRALMNARQKHVDVNYDWNALGSTTSTLTILVRNQLHIVTLGDSQVCVMVPIRSGGRGSNGGYKCVHLSKPKYGLHDNMSHRPPIQVNLNRGSSDEREIRDFLTHYSYNEIIEVPEGAIILAGSDGLFDNLLGESHAEVYVPGDAQCKAHYTHRDEVEAAKKLALERFFRVGHSHIKAFADDLWSRVYGFMWDRSQGLGKQDDCGFWMGRVSYKPPPADPRDGEDRGWVKSSNHYWWKRVIPFNIRPVKNPSIHQPNLDASHNRNKATLNEGYAKHIRFHGPPRTT
uniref:PPM-type phosphatase domain-containing protein n=1 Tax=Mantoniella antarctica TaxID=81844 RepID=A0A7S0S7S1_9CHLO|mmetsp:Transcript_13040/g.31600  ORF Transcript_13040/g.31600 Transcript_13040/m.31600 type:complete len:1452 (+) Transcript_13040:1868-6223(+)